MPAKTTSLLAFELSSTVKVGINVRSDVIAYFGINAAAMQFTTVTRTRNKDGKSRSTYVGGINDATAVNTAVKMTTYSDVNGRPQKGRSHLKLITIPTTRTTPRGTIRTVRIHFPSRASNYAIAMWINNHFSANKPNFFLTPAGRRYPVNVPNVANPDPEATTPPAQIGGSGGTQQALPGNP